MYAAVAELADARDSKSRGAIRAGSSPAIGIEIAGCCPAATKYPQAEEAA